MHYPVWKNRTVLLPWGVWNNKMMLRWKAWLCAVDRSVMRVNVRPLRSVWQSGIRPALPCQFQDDSAFTTVKRTAVRVFGWSLWCCLSFVAMRAPDSAPHVYTSTHRYTRDRPRTCSVFSLPFPFLFFSLSLAVSPHSSFLWQRRRLRSPDTMNGSSLVPLQRVTDGFASRSGVW